MEYYRFTNILPIPPNSELCPKKGRPKTHRSRGRSRVRNEIQVRPKTTRPYAPISYTDLFICYDSSSCDVSPVRYQPHSSYSTFKMKSTLNNDQFSLANIQAARFSNLDFSSDYKIKNLSPIRPSESSKILNTDVMINVMPQPYLSIIDFNLLTRGGIDEATGKARDKTLSPTKTVRSKKNS